MKLPAIGSPFTIEPNATVYFEVPTGQVKVEAKTRNKIPVYSEVSIKAWVTELGEIVRVKQQSGQNLNERRVRGYFLVPKLPAGIRGGDRARVVMETSNGTEELRLFFNERATPIKALVITSLGIPFEGFVQAIGGAF
jgi:hypothetical protein